MVAIVISSVKETLYLRIDRAFECKIEVHSYKLNCIVMKKGKQYVIFLTSKNSAIKLVYTQFIFCVPADY